MPSLSTADVNSLLLLPDAQEESLAAWACPRWSKMRGASLRMGKLNLGGAGTFRMSNMGIGIGSALGLGAAIDAASAGSRSLGIIGGFIVIFFGSQLASVLSGSSAAWRKAKSLGEGNLGAFSALSKRFAHSIAGHLTPNVVFLAYAGLGVAAIVTSLIARATQKSSLLAQINAASSAATALLATSFTGWGRRYHMVEDWKFSHRRSSALLDGSLLLADETYSQLAMMRANSRWSASAAKFSLSPTEAESASRLGNLVSAETNNQSNLIRCLEMIQAAEIPSWHRPAPGLPDLTDLVLSVLAWQRFRFPDLDSISATVDGMAARREAHELQSALPSISEPATPRRQAPRL